jgi:hypothetical protein
MALNGMIGKRLTYKALISTPVLHPIGLVRDEGNESLPN